MIILVWKIYNHLIPNSVNLTFRESTRHGTMCIRDPTTRPLQEKQCEYYDIQLVPFNCFGSLQRGPSGGQGDQYSHTLQKITRPLPPKLS